MKKILYLNGVHVGHYNSVWEETEAGFKFNGVTCARFNKKFNYDIIKDYDILVIDPLHYYSKSLGIYLDVNILSKLKKESQLFGILTVDYWKDLKNLSPYNKFHDFVIFRHSSGIESWKSKQDPCINVFPKVLFSPFSINKDILATYDKRPKLYDICLGGNIITEQYPLRRRLHNLLINTKFKIIDPQKIGKPFDIKKTPYYNGIASSWLSVATTGDHNISVRKYYEICGLGSLPLGNYTKLDDHKLIEDSVVKLHDKMPDREIINIIENALSDKNKLIEMSNKVKDIVLNEYDYRNVFKNLVNDLENLYGTY